MPWFCWKLVCIYVMFSYIFVCLWLYITDKSVHFIHVGGVKLLHIKWDEWSFFFSITFTFVTNPNWPQVMQEYALLKVNCTLCNWGIYIYIYNYSPHAKAIIKVSPPPLHSLYMCRSWRIATILGKYSSNPLRVYLISW